MENKLRQYIWWSIISFLIACPAQAVDAPSVECDGRDATGEVLIPQVLIKRCALCSNGTLEFDTSCLERLVYDYRKQPGQYEDEVEQIMADYTERQLNLTISNMVKNYQHENKARNKAGYPTLPTLTGQDGKEGAALDKSSATECLDSQVGPRCLMEGNNYLSADGVEVLQDMVRTKATLALSEFMENTINYIIPNTTINNNDKKLILPSDEYVPEDKGGNK